MDARSVNSKTISDALFRLYDKPENGDFFEHVLGIFNEYISSSISGYTISDLDARTLTLKVMKTAQGESLSDLDEIGFLMEHHPIVESYYTNTISPVLCTTDFMSVGEWKQTAIYNELYRRLGMVYDTSVRFYFGMRCVGFGFTDTVPLRRDYRRFLNLMAPHLSQAHQACQIQQAGFMGNLPRGMILLSAEGSIIECSAEDADLLKTYFPDKKTFCGRALPDAVERWFRHEADHDSVFKKLIARRDNDMLQLTVLRVAHGYLILTEESKLADPITVYMEMGLTLREAEVLCWVSQGKQNSDVAVILDISTATVRKHMEHVLKKLHCETRGAAARVGLQTVREKSSGGFPAKCLFCTKPTCTSC